MTTTTEIANRGGRRFRAPRFALALPAWAWFAFFFAVPVLWVLYYSFGQQIDIFTQIPDVSHPTLANYKDAFDPDYFNIYKRTLVIAVTGTFLCLLVSLPFAYWLAVRVSPRWRGVLLGLVMVPFWTNFLVRTIGWQLIISNDGLLSNFLQHIGLLSGPLSLIYTKKAVQIGVVYNYLPLMILPLFVAFDRLDASLREASKDLGANRWRTLTQVTLPLAAPGIAAGLLLVFIPLMGDYITASLLGGTKGSMVGVLVANQFNESFNWSLGAAMAVLLILFILAAVLVFSIVALVGRAVIRSRRRVRLPSGGVA